MTSLAIQWQKGIVGLDRMPRLTNLNLRSFKGAENFLEELGFLQELILIEPNVTSIEFLVAYSKLRKLEISYARKLISVAGLRFLKETLIELGLTNLPKIEKYAEILSNLKKLRELRLTTCPPLANLEFVRVLKDLEVFTFVGTEILNGDLSPCVGLRYVGFLNKRNYNFIWNSVASRLEEK